MVVTVTGTRTLDLCCYKYSNTASGWLVNNFVPMITVLGISVINAQLWIYTCEPMANSGLLIAHW